MEDDWRTPVRDKLQRLARVCPHPSRLEVDGQGCLLRVVCDTAHAEVRPALPDMLMHRACYVSKGCCAGNAWWLFLCMFS